MTVKPKINSTDSYDLEGNLCEVPFDNADAASDYVTFVYDAWNRLVKVEDVEENTLVTYERDGIGRIIVNSRTGQTEKHHYWSASWQLLSTFEDDQDDSLVKEYVWGIRYIDEIVATIKYDSEPVRYYHMQDANWNAIMTLYNSASELEAVRYNPYGKANFYFKVGSNWINTGDFSSSLDTNVLFQGRWYETFNVDGNKLRLYHLKMRFGKYRHKKIQWFVC